MLKESGLRCRGLYEVRIMVYGVHQLHVPAEYRGVYQASKYQVKILGEVWIGVWRQHGDNGERKGNRELQIGRYAYYAPEDLRSRGHTRDPESRLPTIFDTY